MLTFDPKRRITAREALKHPYFSERPLPKSPSMMPTFPCKWDEVTKAHDQGYKGKRRYVDDFARNDEHPEDNQFTSFNGELFDKAFSLPKKAKEL